MVEDLPHKIRGAGAFDRFAERASDLTSDAGFFLACVALVLIWVPSYFVFGSLDTWQLVINTATTIVTFLLVALLQDSQRRTRSPCTRSWTRWPTGWPI